MEVKIDKTFQKDTKKIKDQILLGKIADSIVNVQQANHLKQIENIKKLRGSSNDFRIKVGDYRLGIIISESSVEFIRCLHRKDIYKFFPK
ncbi:MAG: type II toxin-antitoxin system RelE/ParE family toxin [Bacteroidales bacterium]|nr:type II toxin-antitoxin system RelE/ParE family toxin [Bacteroidales bacterium]